MVGRRVPHPLRAHPGPQEPAADPEGPFSQAAVASGGCVGQLERWRWWLKCGLARGNPSQVIWGAAFDCQAKGDAAKGSRLCPSGLEGRQPRLLWGNCVQEGAA